MNKEIDQPSGQSNDPESEHRFDSLHTVNRRQLLKTLAAVMGAAALSSVPNRWKTPVIEVGALPAHAQTSSGAVHGSQTFGGSAPFPVPVGVTSLTIEAWGAAGGLGAAFTSLTPVRTRAPASGVATSALGGYVRATITVTPGEVLSVVVGMLAADGVSSDGSGPGLGGFGGSQGGVTTGGDGGTGPFGPGGGGGGGASFVLRGATTLLVVAGAGGGSGGQGSSTLSIPGSGGAGGGTTGQNGTPSSGNAGASGSPGAGGVGGIGGATAPAGSPGTSGGVSAADNPGQGGTGGAGSVGNSGGGVGGGSGGGGGGGWTGGGGGGGGGGEGGSGGGGGGGSSYTIPSATLVTHTQGVKADNGQVILTW